MVFPFRSEGFGIPILESAACGTPVIVTKACAATEFLSEKGTLWIDTEPELRWARVSNLSDAFVYERAKWHEPSEESLRKQMREVFNHHKKWRTKAMKQLVHLKINYSWDAIGKEFEQIIKGMK